MSEETGFASSPMVRITFSSTYGAGTDGPKSVRQGTTLRELFEQELPGQDPTKFKIRLNRQPDAVPGNYILQEGDRVSVNPSKTEGN